MATSDLLAKDQTPISFAPESTDQGNNAAGVAIKRPMYGANDGAIVTMGSTTDGIWSGTGAGTFMSVLKAGVQRLLGVGGAVQVSNVGRTSNVAVTPTVTAGAYTAGQVVGGLLTFNGAVDTQLSGLIESVRLGLKTVQTGTFKLYVFSAAPTNSTFTDKVAPSINALDVPLLMDVYTLSTADSGLGTHTLYSADAITKAIVLSTNALYGVLVTVSAVTLGSTSDVTISVGIIKD